MQIICNAKGKQTIINLLDVALKAGGIANIEVANNVLKSLENADGYIKKQEEIEKTEGE